MPRSLVAGWFGRSGVGMKGEGLFAAQIPWCPQIRTSLFLSGCAIVIDQKAAEPVTAVHRTFSRKLREFRPDEFVLEPLMVSFLMIMFNELRNCFSQGGFAKEDQVVQARLPDRANETLGKGIRLGRPRGKVPSVLLPAVESN